MVFEAEPYTIGCMIRGFHIYKDFWSSCIGEMLYCILHDERSAERWSGTVAKQNQNVYSLEVLVKKQRLIKSQNKEL